MEVISNNYLPGDPRLVQQLVNELKSQGIFDQFRKECFADVDTKPAYQNLRQRVEGSVAAFLKEQTWSPDMNKNQVREQLKKNIYESGYLETGVERIVDQVVNPKINTVFLPIVEDVVYKYLGIEKWQDPNIKVTTNATDLLPKDLEAVSPESVQSSKPDDQKDDTDTLNESLTSKMDEDESPPFEPLEGVHQTVTTFQEETSLDSELSGISGLQSHESNLASESKSSQMDWSWQDAQLSQNSSESKLSAITSEEQKTDISRDFVFSKNTDSDSMSGTNKIEYDAMKTEDSVESMVIEDDSTIDSQKQNMKMKVNKPLEEDNTEQKSNTNREDENKKNKERKSSETRKDEKNKIEEKKPKSSSHKYSLKEDKHTSKYDKHSSKDVKHRKSSSSKDKSSSRHSSSSKDRDSKDSTVKVKEKSKDSKDESKNSKEKESKISKEVIEKDRHDRDKTKEKDKYNKSKDKEDEKSSKQKYDKERKSKKEGDKDRLENDKNKNDRDKSSKDKSERQKSEKEISGKETTEKDRERSKDRSEKNKSHKDRDKMKKSSDKNEKKDRDRSKSSSSSSIDKNISSTSSSNTKESSSSTSIKKKESDKDSKSADKHKKDKHSRDKSSEISKEKKRDSKKDDHYSSKEKKNHRRSFDRDSSDGQSGKNSNTITSESRISNSQQNSKESSSNSFSGSGDSGNSDATETVSENQEKTETDNEIQPTVEVPKMKYIKPKFALNFEEAKRIMKIRKQLAILERQNQLSLADLSIVHNGFGKAKSKKESNETENKDVKTNDDDTPKNSPFRGFDKDSEKEPCNTSVDDTKERLSSADLNLQSIFLSKENWEALEARLEQEMLKINFNAYESHYDDYDDNECSSVTISPMKNASVRNSCVIEEIIPRRMLEDDKQKPVLAETADKSAIEVNIEQNEEIDEPVTEEMDYEPVDKQEIIEEIVELDCQIEQMNESVIVTEEIIEEIIETNDIVVMNIIEESDGKDIRDKIKNNHVIEKKKLSIKLHDVGKSNNYNCTLETEVEENNANNESEEESDICTHFDKRDVSSSLTKLEILHKIIGKLESDLEYSIKEYQNNISPENTNKVAKRGRKRKFDENVDLKNNNSLNYAKITGIKKRGRPPKSSTLKIGEEKSCNNTDILLNQNFSLPLSPAESETFIDKKEEYPVTPLKQRKMATPRVQRYTSDDLYKPRPTVPGTKRSKREKNP